MLVGRGISFGKLCSWQNLQTKIREMPKSEREYLLELWSKNICPYCGNTIPEGKRVGAGRKSKGEFCSLDCYVRYYEQELKERVRRIAKLAERHRKS